MVTKDSCHEVEFTWEDNVTDCIRDSNLIIGPGIQGVYFQALIQSKSILLVVA